MTVNSWPGVLISVASIAMVLVGIIADRRNR